MGASDNFAALAQAERSATAEQADHAERTTRARQRWVHELMHIAPRLVSHESQLRVLDLGSGDGRWATALEPNIARYVGLDMNRAAVEHAQHRVSELPTAERFRVERSDLAEGLPGSIAAHSIDLVILSDVLSCLCDYHVDNLLNDIGHATDRGAIVYLREPLSSNTQLPSFGAPGYSLSALGLPNARTPDQLGQLLQRWCKTHSFTLQEQAPAYPATLEQAGGVRHFYFLFTRR